MLLLAPKYWVTEKGNLICTKLTCSKFCYAPINVKPKGGGGGGLGNPREFDRDVDRQTCFFFIWGLIQRKYIDYNLQISKNYK